MASIDGITLGSPLAGPSRPQKLGSWLPLPYMHAGFVIHPHKPTRVTSVNSPKSPNFRNRFSWSGVPPLGLINGSGGTGEAGNIFELSLDVGDEVFAFEEYKCSFEEDGKGETWYRGFMVPPLTLTELAPDYRTTPPFACPKVDTQVVIGIFPATIVHVVPGAPNDDGTLAAAFDDAMRDGESKLLGSENHGLDHNATLTKSTLGELPEEDGDEIEGYSLQPETGNEVVNVTSGAQGHKLPPTQNGISRPHRPKSLLLDKRQPPQQSQTAKPQPPVPTITAGDSTSAGQAWPLVDEIACAIREWHERLPTYLANREYRLFDIVMQHIDCLFVGRRQILAQTHSEDELARVMRECVSRLVKCNVAQGLDVIVRSLKDGSVMVVDRDRIYAGTSWISGITCYVYQVQLAYIDLIPLDALFGKDSLLVESGRTSGSVSQPMSSTPRQAPHSLAERSGSFHHLFLDVKAIIASPCAVGETVELYFSLYDSAKSRFITEEFVAIYNHLGTPARDPEQRLGKVRTIYTDLKPDDLSGSTYLVCRIVRNGAMALKADALAPRGEIGRRTSTARGSRGNLLTETGASRRASSVFDSSATDDSFSITSGFGADTLQPVETVNAVNTNVVEGRPSFKRPFGCAVLALPQLQKLLADSSAAGNPGLELSMPIHVPREESSFATMHDDLIAGRVKDYQNSNRAESIAICLKGLHGVYSQLVREQPSILLDVPQSARLGFSDVVYPGTFRNDIYLKLWSASFVPLASSSGSIRVRKSTVPANQGDVQVSIEVRRPDGTTVQDAIYAGGSGEPPSSIYHSMVFHHNDSPVFGELLKVSLPPKLDDCHLFLSFRSRGKDRAPSPLDPSELEKPFAFTFLPLLSPSSCITDGAHELILYRMEKNLQPSPKMYFDAPHSATDQTILSASTAKSMTPLSDRLTLRSYLCSSVNTTNQTLRALLDRKQIVSDLNKLLETLQMFNFVGEEEIAKFVPAILDALFGFMVANFGERQDEIDDLVFQALVKVLSMTTDRRFANFDEVIDIYVANQFNFPPASFNLLRAMKKTMASPSTTEYRAFIKVWHLVFRFVFRARALDRSKGIGLDATSAHIEADFRRQIKAILGDIDTLVKSEDRTLIGTQTLAVQHYADIIPHLSQVFTPMEIAEIVISFADALTNTKGSIGIHKLLLLLQVVRSTFDTSEARAMLVPAMIRWIRPHLGRYEEDRGDKSESQATRDARRIKWMECNRLAVTVSAWMVNKLQEWHVSPSMEDDETARLQEEDNLEYCLTLLPRYISKAPLHQSQAEYLSLVKSYDELSGPAALETLKRQHSGAHIWKQTPDVFPMSHPFALFAQLPPPSLSERHKQLDEASLPPQSEIFNCGLAETAVVILSLVFATPQQNLSRWLSEMLDIQGTYACSQSLTTIFRFAKSVLRAEAFPKQWLTLSLMAHGAIVRFMSAAAEIMEKEEFIPLIKDSSDFDVSIWSECLELLCDVCLSDALTLEEHTHQRRRAGWIIAGDLREEAITLLVRLWNAIGWPIDGTDATGQSPRYGGYQTRFTSLAERVLSLCMSSHDETCQAAVEILFSMIYAEYILDGKFDAIETEVFGKLDKLFANNNASPAEPASRAWFVTELRHVFETGPTIDSAFHSKVGLFLEEIELFIALLDNVRELPSTSQWGPERAEATYQMLDFIRRIGRDTLYIRFVHQLKDIFLRDKHYLSAGLTLKLHADMYDWKIDGDRLGESDEGGLVLPPQSQFERKEAVYRQCLDYFADAQAYEHALELTEEMTRQHRQKTWNVERLAELTAYQARLWDKMASVRRHKPEYYRIAFYGEYTPAMNQAKEFIVRGEPWHQFSDFCDNLQLKYPEATLHKSKMQPAPPVRSGSEQVIWVTSVTPEPDLSQPMFADGVNENIQHYYRHNAIQTFSSLRPYRVHSPATNDEEDDGSGVMTWLEKAILTTKETFPGVLSRSEVAHVQYEHLSPIDAAINNVKDATTGLNTHLGSSTRQPDVKQLGTAINGAVDSPVQGGVKLYRQTFLNERYVSRHPEEEEQIAELRGTVLDYARTIQKALDLHGRICKDAAFHEALRSHFMRSFPDEIAVLSISLPSEQQAGPLPPLDLDSTSNALFSQASPRKSDVSSRPSITVTAPYALSPLRLDPSPQTPSKSPPVPSKSCSLNSPPISNGTHAPHRAASPTSTRAKSPISSPSDLRPNPLFSFGSRLSFIGSNRSSDTVAGADTLSTSDSVSRKGSRLSRLGSLMRKK